MTIQLDCVVCGFPGHLSDVYSGNVGCASPNVASVTGWGAPDHRVYSGNPGSASVSI